MRFAEVAVDAPTGHDRTFSYSIPESLTVRAGHLVRVPFGARRLQGLVFELSPVPQVPETRSISGVMGDEPILSKTRLELARWISQYYMSSLFEAAALMLPPGGRIRHRTLLELSPNGAAETTPLTPSQRRVVEYLRRRGTTEHDLLVAALGPGVRNSIGPLLAKGVLTRSFRQAGPAVHAKVRPHISLSPQFRHHVVEWLPRATKRAPRQAALMARLVDGDRAILAAEARKEFGATAVSALIAKGWLRQHDVAMDRDNVFWMFGLRIEEDKFGMNRDELRRRLAQNAIETRTFFIPMHLQPVFFKRFESERFPVSERLCAEGLYLPSSAVLTDADIDFICECIAHCKS